MIQTPSTLVKRDLRIDFFRGCALTIILIDHIEMQNGLRFVQPWTFMSIGLSDMAEAFVFLSGYAFGMAFDRRMQRDGITRCLKRALGRSTQIYAGYLVTLCFMLTFGMLLTPFTPRVACFVYLDSPVFDHLWGAMLFSNHPYGSAILAFYGVILPFGVIQVWLLRRYRVVAWYLSINLYVFSQFYPQFNFTSVVPPERSWYMNMLAWQFLYFVGIAFGMGHLKMPQKKAGVFLVGSLAIVILTLGFIVQKHEYFSGSSVAMELSGVLRSWPELVSKQSCGVLRLVHFFGVASLFAFLSRRFPDFADAMPAWPLVLIGQHPLLIYCTGLVLSLVSVAVMPWWGTSFTSLAMLYFDLALLLFVFAYIGHRLGTSSR